MKNRLLFSFIILFYWVSSAQNTSQSIDSLTQKSFKELYDGFYNSKPDTLKCIQYANAYYKKALKKKDTKKLMTGKYFLADIKNNNNLYLNFCDSLIRITQKKPTKNFPSVIYYEKGRFLRHKSKKSKALENLLLVNKQKIKNDSLEQISNILIAAIKSSTGKSKEAISIYKNIFKYAQKNDLIRNNKFNVVLMNIAICYKNLNKLDSALYYNEKARKLYKTIGDSLSLGYSYYSLGGILYTRKEFLKSIDSYLKSIPSIINDENYKALNIVYSRIGSLYDSLNIPNKSLIFHLKVDSLTIKSKSLSRSYKYLVKYYKNENNSEKQLEYINKLLDLNEYLFKEKQKINKTFTEEYDIPNLLAEKKKIISQLEYKVQRSKRNRIIYISLLILFLVLISYQIKKKRTYKKRFLALVNQENFVSKPSDIQPKNTEKYKLADTIVSDLLLKLDSFEQRQDFLSNIISLQTLATLFDTNANYLSKVINQHKQTTFSNYINKLRIEYTINKLKSDPLWRKYTVKAIAEEVGFKNAESFSKAFYKYTKLKPSYFIKELEKAEVN